MKLLVLLLCRVLLLSVFHQYDTSKASRYFKFDSYSDSTIIFDFFSFFLTLKLYVLNFCFFDENSELLRFTISLHFPCLRTKSIYHQKNLFVSLVRMVKCNSSIYFNYLLLSNNNKYLTTLPMAFILNTYRFVFWSYIEFV